MKPAPFEYLRAEDRQHALSLLAEHADEAKLLAGGQSLAAVMNLRLARPERLIDIDRVAGLSSLTFDREVLRVGALTRHRHLEVYPGDLGHHELLRRAARYIGHYPVRTRGTVGGSIAHADPSAEWVLLAALLDAEVVVESVRGARRIPAATFFEGYFTTALADDELVTEVCFPAPGTRSAITEYARRHGDFAIVAAAVSFDLDADGRCLEPRVALGGVASVPLRADAAAAALAGRTPDAAAITEAAAAAAEAIDPARDGHGDANYRRHLTRTLVTRALTEAAHGVRGPGTHDGRDQDGSAHA